MPDKKVTRKKVIHKHVKGFIDEFRTFAVKGNVIDLGIAVIIGASFNTIVQSLVKDVIMPCFGKLLGNVDFSQLYVNLSEQTFPSLSEAEAASAPVIRYGLFINNVINFFIVALTIFIVLKIFFKSKFKDGKVGK